MLRPIQGTQRLPRHLFIGLTGTGTAVLGEGKFDATLVDNGTGDYTLTFAKPFNRAPIAQITSRTSAVAIQIFALTKSAIQIKTFGVDGTTAKDAVIDIAIHGNDSDDII